MSVNGVESVPFVDSLHSCGDRAFNPVDARLVAPMDEPVEEVPHVLFKVLAAHGEYVAADFAGWIGDDFKGDCHEWDVHVGESDA